MSPPTPAPKPVTTALGKLVRSLSRSMNGSGIRKVDFAPRSTNALALTVRPSGSVNSTCVSGVELAKVSGAAKEYKARRRGGRINRDPPRFKIDSDEMLLEKLRAYDSSRGASAGGTKEMREIEDGRLSKAQRHAANLEPDCPGPGLLRSPVAGAVNALAPASR